MSGNMVSQWEWESGCVGGWGYTVVNVELPLHNLLFFNLMTYYFCVFQWNKPPLPTRPLHVSLRHAFFQPQNVTFILQFIVYCLENLTATALSICLNMHIDLHARHVSHHVGDVWHWQMIFNTVPLCSCPLSICVHLGVFVMSFFLSVAFVYLCCHLFVLIPMSVCFCLCALSSLFVFHPCLFIRWTL